LKIIKCVVRRLEGFLFGDARLSASLHRMMIDNMTRGGRISKGENGSDASIRLEDKGYGPSKGIGLDGKGDGLSKGTRSEYQLVVKKHKCCASKKKSITKVG
jgi:hypothetical protein